MSASKRGLATDKGRRAKDEHAWLIWDWRRDATRMPFDASVGDAAGGVRGLWRATGRPSPARRRLLGQLPGDTA
jgi:hypothetical protein